MKVYIGEYPSWFGPYQLADLTQKLGVSEGRAFQLGGRVLRLVLGPTNFDFHRFYARILLQQTGQESDHQWITIANE